MLIMNNELTKIAKNASYARPILRAIHYNSEFNTIEVTDSHRAISLQSKTDIESELTIGIDHGMPLSSNYPTLSRLFREQNKVTFKLIKLLDDGKQIKKEYKGDDVVKLVLDNNILKINDTPIIEVNGNADEFEETSFNLKYISELLDFIKKVKNEGSTITLLWDSKLSPIQINFEGTINGGYLLTPIRHYE